MNEQNHPITPPPELFKQWEHLPRSLAFEAAYRAGADQELEACVKWIEDCGYHPSVPEDLRTARRPKPPSLKEQALALLQPGEPRLFNSDMQNIIRRALEQLDD